MATKKQNRSKAPIAEPQVSQQEPAQAEEEILSAEIRQETDALMNVAEKLASASKNFSKQQQELQSVRSMQQEMQSVLTQIVQGIEKASVASATERESAVAPQGQYVSPVVEHETIRDNGECGCECIHPGCCCFEIVLDKVRGIQPQMELADIGDTTVPLPTINELEVRLFASIDNIGVLIPSLSTTMGVRVPSGSAGGGPGLWMPLGCVIGRVCLKKGTSRTITVDFQGSEVDEGIERPLGFKDEHGAASGSITLDCCSSRIYPPMPTDLSFDQGGIGGGQPGAISIAFFARRVCC